MGIIELSMLGFGLGMDAFAVAVCKGLNLKNMQWKFAFIVGLYFGIFQAVMPFLGYLSGMKFGGFIIKYGGIITFFLLLIIGINMIKEKNEKSISNDIDFISMIILAIATSIDAFAVGITFSLLDVNIYLAIFLIGIITFLVSIIGVKIGNVFGYKYEKIAQIIGGCILIAIGIKSLLEYFNIFPWIYLKINIY